MLRRIVALVAPKLLLLALLAFAQPALAQVRLSFHSFNGSMFGRYPHAFIVLEGTLDATGQAINENYGYSAVTISPMVMLGSVPGMIYVEKAKYIQSTNRHFTVPISDAQYLAIIAEKDRWAHAPYLLDTHNCTHFVARIAEMVGLQHTAVPKDLVRKPKAWLNLLARENPQLHARQIP